MLPDLPDPLLVGKIQAVTVDRLTTIIGACDFLPRVDTAYWLIASYADDYVGLADELFLLCGQSHVADFHSVDFQSVIAVGKLIESIGYGYGVRHCSAIPVLMDAVGIVFLPVTDKEDVFDTG